MKINDNVYVLHSTKGSYVYAVAGDENILVDTGFSLTGGRLLKELKSIGIDPSDIRHIILTHHDLDHIGNAALLQNLSGADIWASQQDIPYIKGELKRPGIKRIFSIINKVKKPVNVKAYQDYKMGEFQIIPTPGHTPGHVCVLYRDVLFVGDLVKNIDGKLVAYPNLNWDVAQLKESIEKIAELPFKWVCPAHGEPIERGTQWERILNR